jgi:ATP-dependent Clp protease ATP-binding subunit ClpB
MSIKKRGSPPLIIIPSVSLKRTIQRELQDPLALKILAGEFREGDVIQVDRSKDRLVFTATMQGEVVEAQ